MDRPLLPKDEFLSIKEFAVLIRVHSNTIRRGIKSGRIHAFKIGDGKNAIYRIPRTEINRLSVLDLEKIIDVLIEKRLNPSSTTDIL